MSVKNLGHPLPLSFCARATAGQEIPQTAGVRLPREAQLTSIWLIPFQHERRTD